MIQGKQFVFLIGICAIISCTSSEVSDEPINGMKYLVQFSHEKAALKYDSANKTIATAKLLGRWELIASFFTVKEQGIKTSFRLEGGVYTLKDDGTLIVDNTALGAGIYEHKWYLDSTKTKFYDKDDSYRVRISGDTMEWIGKNDIDFLYFLFMRR